jgi:NAD(P)-dependent dehydrogenase (short-subunit alcohol dehydrogenase family)
MDVTDGKSVARLIEGVVSAHGRLDYAFNNGGSGGASAPVTKMSEAAWRKTIDGYPTSVFLCMSAEIAAMKEPKTSVIVNNASVDGLRGYPFAGGAAYSAAKLGSSVLPLAPLSNTQLTVPASVRSAQAGSAPRR